MESIKQSIKGLLFIAYFVVVFLGTFSGFGYGFYIEGKSSGSTVEQWAGIILGSIAAISYLIMSGIIVGGCITEPSPQTSAPEPPPHR